MRSINKLKILRFWMGANLPTQYMFFKDKPKTVEKMLGLYFKRWFIHPMRRKLARYYLMMLKNLFGLKVIAITGSAGKTSTKEMVKSILSKKGKTVASFKNIDPVYNIPQTIFKCLPTTQYLILEMGVEYVGEMEFYLWLAKPDISVITNIFPTHTQYFGDEKGVYKEKLRIISSLGRKDHAVLNAGDKFLKKADKHTKAKVIFFGEGTNVTSYGVKYKDKSTIYTLLLGKSKINIHLPIIGRQFVENSLAAAAIARLLEVSDEMIKNGLESFEKPEHRMNAFYSKSGVYVLDDSYNNNPWAARETINIFNEVAKERKKILIIGDMLELGKQEKIHHKELGVFISGYKFELVVGVGEASKVLVKEASLVLGKENCRWAKDYEEAYNIVKDKLGGDSAILIKGSRAIGLENVVMKIK